MKYRHDLIAEFKQLVNRQLPAIYTQPVRFNHCFNRIILDWLFKDCWYHHLDNNRTALSQLNEVQLRSAIQRMKAWLSDHSLLTNDNIASLKYRNKLKIPF